MFKNRHWAQTLCLLLLLASCRQSQASPPSDADLAEVPPTIPVRNTVIPKGYRRLGIDITTPQDDDYDKALALVQAAGADTVELAVFWDDIERSPGDFNPDPNWLAIANSYYPATGMQVALTISVLDTTTARLPSDLAGRPFDHPKVIARFNALLDFIATQLPETTLISISIGNEVDVYLGDDPEQWDQYGRFFSAATNHAHVLWPNVPIGVKATLNALTGDATSQLQTLNEVSDVILATYYPLDDAFMVRPPTVVREDIGRLLSAYPDKRVYLLESGYPSGAANGSSEGEQAAFVHELFTVWDEVADQMPVVFFTWLTDLPESSVRELQGYYNLPNSAFAEFLGTLGLRTYAGTGMDKAAFRQLKAETSARGW